jgi:hypothetical protein
VTIVLKQTICEEILHLGCISSYQSSSVGRKVRFGDNLIARRLLLIKINSTEEKAQQTRRTQYFFVKKMMRVFFVIDWLTRLSILKVPENMHI